jgi:NADH:ubiquinone oxidoreductase subunit 6 (subunit J)
MMITQANPVHAALSFALVVLSTCGLFLLLAAPFLMAATIIVYAGAIVVTFLFVIMLAQQEGPSSADQRSREPFLASLAGCILLASLTCILHKSHDTRELDHFIHQLQRVAAAKDAAEVEQVMGDPAKLKPTELDSELTLALLKRFRGRDDTVTRHVNNMNQSWAQLRVPAMKSFEPLKAEAKLALAAVESRRRTQGSLALDDVPGKSKGAPSHFAPGTLPAANVAGLGRTLFTDYLVPVELAAVLLLVATIGAIVIAGRRSEELR